MPKTLSNFSLNLASSSDQVLEFTDVEVHNQLNDTSTRFEFVFDSTHGLNLADQAVCFPDVADPTSVVIPDHAVWGIRGFSISSTGGEGLGPNTSNDSHYDAVNDSWLLATVRYKPLVKGTTEFFLQIGEVGMSHPNENTSEFDAVFGDPSDPALNAETNRCVNSATSEATVTVTDPLIGDFNNNGVLDGGDIDLLSDEVRKLTPNAAFDLTAGADVNAADRTYWVESLAGTFFGDTNLDKTVGFTDFLPLSANYLREGTWSTGDFTGDRFVGFDDFLQLASNYLKTAAVAVPVPEPSHTELAVVGGILLLMGVRRRA
jgi:hypothetical protein